MKRSDFLAILSAIPFIRKKKGIAEQFNVPEARLQGFESATFTNLKEKQEEFLIDLNQKFVLTRKEIDLVEFKNKYKG